VGAGKLVDGLPFQKAQPERLDPVTKACPKRCVPSDRPLLIGGSMETGSYILVGKAAMPFRERKLDLSKLPIRSRGGIQYVERTEVHGEKLIEPVCDLGLDGIVSSASHQFIASGPSRT